MIDCWLDLKRHARMVPMRFLLRVCLWLIGDTGVDLVAEAARTRIELTK